VGAHVAELRRTRAGQFKIAGCTDARSIERDKRRRSESLDQVLTLAGRSRWRTCQVTELTPDDARRVGQGIDLQIEEANARLAERSAVRLRNSDGRLIAVGIYDS